MSYEVEIKYVEPGILLISPNGMVNAMAFERHTHARLASVNRNVTGPYVVIYDLRHAVLVFFDLHVTKWSAEVDPNMIEAILVSQQRIVRVGIEALSRIVRLRMPMVSTMEEAIVEARRALEERGQN